MKQSLDSRLSKAQVTAIAGNLHHDECGIEAMFSQMKQTGTPRVAYNAAWVLSHLSKEDKRIYLLPHYGELVDMATSAKPCFRRGLLLAILADFPMGEPNGKLLDFCLTQMNDPKESDSSRSAMIKLAARMCKPYPELCKELLREFGIRKYPKKLVISQIFCTFIVESQIVTKDISDDYQGQS